MNAKKPTLLYDGDCDFCQSCPYSHGWFLYKWLPGFAWI